MHAPTNVARASPSTIPNIAFTGVQVANNPIIVTAWMTANIVQGLIFPDKEVITKHITPDQREEIERLLGKGIESLPVVDGKPTLHITPDQADEIRRILGLSESFPIHESGPIILSTPSENGVPSTIVLMNEGKGVDIPYFDVKRLPQERQYAVNDTLSHINNGTIPAGPTGYRWGRPFNNRPRDGQTTPDLPEKAADGSQITYNEYRVTPRPGQTDGGTDRIVVGSDGRRYYTGTHYGTGENYPGTGYPFRRIN